MKLQEAVISGIPFKRKKWTDFLIIRNKKLIWDIDDRGNFTFNYEDLIADDYELKSCSSRKELEEIREYIMYADPVFSDITISSMRNIIQKLLGNHEHDRDLNLANSKKDETAKLAFHNQKHIKDRILAQLRSHYEADEIIKGIYWEGGKGCAVGCTIHSEDHSKYETELGIPSILAYLEDSIFEGLPNHLAKKWPLEFIEAIPIGKDLSNIWPKFAIWLLTDPISGVLKYAKTQEAKNIIQKVAKIYEKKLSYPKKEWKELLEGATAAVDAIWVNFWAASTSASAYAATAAAADVYAATAASPYVSATAADYASASAAYYASIADHVASDSARASYHAARAYYHDGSARAVSDDVTAKNSAMYVQSRKLLQLLGEKDL